ncbi:GDP-Man:Man(3)GlcNAc(2)-PP-Dol alpha-1,2-mannosyltransferase-like [Rhopilema esculentum]|uniref:GDP-Man:Man(3)GlcNAc(2)-PP-Dol alpha-1,2-mannosyltransferase-like n=1 Tax=Rhopilema esculentum TaxID=499914 RepID=UPI0031D7ED6A|eukprot:gene316-9971_t
MLPLLLLLRMRLRRRTRELYPSMWTCSSTVGPPVVVAFFHPYCNAGGGGERVLWCSIRALQRRHLFVHCVVYTGDCGYTPEEILERAKERFNIDLHKPVHFVFLKKRRWVEAEMWPYFTLLGQSLGSMLLGLEALLKFAPDVYIDTMGYAFTFPIFKFLGGCNVGCYVHYPTISTDMLTKVKRREAAFNNASIISKSIVLTQAKLLYYKMFALLYGIVGSCSSITMVNSSWTYNHILQIWKKPACMATVYPPCDTAELAVLNNVSEDQEIKVVISIGQFRPEKNHQLQIKSFSKFLKSQKSKCRSLYRLLLVGSCRNTDDEKRVDDLKNLCEELQISEYVDFHLNIPFPALKQLLSQASIGIHTMWNEHFGIGVVEFMAAGVIALAHDSGGPKLDIVTKWNEEKTGFLASDVTGYSASISEIFQKDREEREEIRQNAKESVQHRFSEKIFEDEFLKCTEHLLR